MAQYKLFDVDNNVVVKDLRSLKTVEFFPGFRKDNCRVGMQVQNRKIIEVIYAAPTGTGTAVRNIDNGVWNGGNSFIISREYFTPTPPPPIVPVSVTPSQARRALATIVVDENTTPPTTMLDSVNAFVSTQSEETKIMWEYALEIRRDNSIVTGAMAALNITEEQMDNLFIAAAQFE